MDSRELKVHHTTWQPWKHWEKVWYCWENVNVVTFESMNVGATWNTTQYSNTKLQQCHRWWVYMNTKHQNDLRMLSWTSNLLPRCPHGCHKMMAHAAWHERVVLATWGRPGANVLLSVGVLPLHLKVIAKPPWQKGFLTCQRVMVFSKTAEVFHSAEGCCASHTRRLWRGSGLYRYEEVRPKV